MWKPSGTQGNNTQTRYNLHPRIKTTTSNINSIRHTLAQNHIVNLSGLFGSFTNCPTNVLYFQFWETISAEHGIQPDGTHVGEDAETGLDRVNVYWTEVSGAR